MALGCELWAVSYEQKRESPVRGRAYQDIKILNFEVLAGKFNIDIDK